MGTIMRGKRWVLQCEATTKLRYKSPLIQRITGVQWADITASGCGMSLVTGIAPGRQ